MNIINYPFYCIDNIDTIEASLYMRNHLHVHYGWTIRYLDRNDTRLSRIFFKSKMHVFSVIVNGGFRI